MTTIRINCFNTTIVIVLVQLTKCVSVQLGEGLKCEREAVVGAGKEHIAKDRGHHIVLLVLRVHAETDHSDIGGLYR